MGWSILHSLIFEQIGKLYMLIPSMAMLKTPKLQMFV